MDCRTPPAVLTVLLLAAVLAKANFPPNCDCHSFPSHHDRSNPFCGSDGLMYANECLAACQGILHAKDTPCAMPIHLLNPILVEGGASAYQITQRFQHAGFRFLGVANLTRQEEVMAEVGQSSSDGTTEPNVTAQSPHDHPNVDFLFTRQGHVYGRSSAISDSSEAVGGRRLFGDKRTGERKRSGHGKHTSSGSRGSVKEIKSNGGNERNDGDSDGGGGGGSGDNRKYVENTSVDPWRKIGWLEPTGCTGSLVGPRHILTNAHCVFSQEYGEFFPLTFRFSPGLQEGFTPFGTVTSNFVLVKACFTNDNSPECDFAVVVADEEIGEGIGWFGLDIGCKKDDGIGVTIAGYPIDMASENGQRTMWMESCQTGRLGCTYGPRLISHDCKVMDGNSGSPLFDSKGRIRAIHSGLQNVEGGGAQAQAVSITPFVYKSVKKWVWKTYE